MDEIRETFDFKTYGYVRDIDTWIKTENRHGINIVYLNIRSVRKNFRAFVAYLDNVLSDIHIIVLVEVNINQKAVSDERASLNCFEIRGYKLECELRPKGQGGGIFVLMKNELVCESCHLHSKAFESHMIKVKVRDVETNTEEITILAVYRPPEKKKTDFLEEMKTCISRIPNENSLIVIGDFNINLNNKSKYEEDFKDLMVELGMIRGVDVNTREEKRGKKLVKSCVDNILIRPNGFLKNKRMETAVFKTKTSDHYTLSLHIRAEHSKDQRKNEKIAINEEKVKRLMKEVKWEELKKSPGKVYEEMKKIMDQVYEKSSYRVKHGRESKKRNKTWVTEDIKEKIKERDELWRQYRNKIRLGVRDENLHERYQKMRNMVNRLTRKASNEYYYSKMDENKGDGRKVWEIINEMLGRQKKSNVDSIISKYMLKEENNTEKKVADKFAETFNRGVKSIRHICSKKITRKTKKQPLQNMRIVKATESDVKKIMEEMKIKTGSGTDKIRMKDLVDEKENIAGLIAEWINESLETGKIPEECKVAKVRPIYKGGDHGDPKNYRPISILNAMNKILEKYVYNMTMNYVKTSKIMNKNQFGFQPGKRITTLLNKVTNTIYGNLDEGKYTLCLFIDYQKAFDTLGHQTILDSLEDVGITGKMKNWFKEYLRGRMSEVCVLNSESERFEMDSGVPQGSFLGPLLFILVTNSIWDGLQDGEIYLYADDVCILLSDKSIEKLFERAQKIFDGVQAWSHDNGLTMNAIKTKYMIIQDERKRVKGEGELVVHEPECLHNFENNECGCEKRIERVKCAKYLGLWFDEFFTWREHVRHVRGKLRSCMAAMVRLGNRASDRIKKVVYMALGDSHLNYGITAWGNCLLTHRKKLTVIQNKILRYMYGENFKQISNKNNIMGLERKFVYRLFVEYYFDNEYKIEKQTERVTRASTSSIKYMIPKIRTEYGRKQHAWMIPTIWEKLPNELKNLITYKGAKFFGKEWAFSLGRDFFENKLKIKLEPKKKPVKIGIKQISRKFHYRRGGGAGISKKRTKD